MVVEMISYWGVDHGDEEVAKALRPISGAKLRAAGRLTRMGGRSARQFTGEQLRSITPRTWAGVGLGAGALGGAGGVGYAAGRRKRN